MSDQLLCSKGNLIPNPNTSSLNSKLVFTQFPTLYMYIFQMTEYSAETVLRIDTWNYHTPNLPHSGRW